MSIEARRPPGRPPAYQRQEAQPAVVDTTLRHVPPLVCPECGRGMTPKVIRWRGKDKNGVDQADCQCTLNGCLFPFVYQPATVRKK